MGGSIVGAQPVLAQRMKLLAGGSEGRRAVTDSSMRENQDKPPPPVEFAESSAALGAEA